MHKSNAVQLRLALSAAAACAVLAAATFSGAHRAGSLSIIVALQVEPILARSVSTIRTPSIENLEDSYDASSRPFDEALLRRAFDVAKAAQEAGDHPFGTVLADEKGQIPHRAGQRIYERRRRLHRPRPAAACIARGATSQPRTPHQMHALFCDPPCAMCAGAIYWAGIGRVVTEVVGLLLEDEAAALQADFWKARDTHRSCVVSV